MINFALTTIFVCCIAIVTAIIVSTWEDME